MNTPPAQLLIALSGRPSVHGPEGPRPLQFKYRKTTALLGYLVSQPRREVRRELVAQLLWPDLDTQAGRANLRVVLADLQAQWRQLALPEAIEVQRDWIGYRPGPALDADVDLLTQMPARGVSADRPAAWDTLLQFDPEHWLAGAEEGTSEEFAAWLASQRRRMVLVREAVDALPPTPVPAATRAPEALVPGAAAEIAAITLLRVQLFHTAASDRQPSTPEFSTLLTTLGVEARRFHGIVLDVDDSGCTLGFGVDSRHTGQRWHALRCAAALAAMMPPGQPLSAGATHGWVLLERQPQLRAVGWRLRLAERLAQRADAGEIVYDESLADMTLSFGCRALGSQRFRGMAREFTLYGCSLNETRTGLPPGGDFAGSSFFGREPLVVSLLDTLRSAPDNGPHAICLSGEAGVGKTRAAWECAHRWQAHGDLVVWMAAMPEGAATPWRVLHDLLASLFSQANAAACAELPAETRQALVAFLETRNVSRRQRALLAEGVGRLMQGSESRPTLVVLDDVQWLDHATAEFLVPLAALQPQLRWLLTRRTDMPQLLPFPGLVEVPLLPLDDAAARSILQSLPDGPDLLPEVLRGRIASARGLPLYLLAGSLNPDGASHFNEFCQAMLNRLGPLREGMEAAAVLGMLFSREDLAHLCGEAHADASIDRALALGLAVSRGLGHAAFFHARLREYVLSATAPERLQRFARAAAGRALQQRMPSRAAGLWEQAAEPQAAAAAWYQAAQQALAEDDISAACDSSARLASLGYFPGAAGIEARIFHGRCLIARHGYGSDQAHAVVVELGRMALPPSLDPNLLFDMQMLAYLGSSSQGHTHGLDHARRLQAMASSPGQHFAAAWAMGNTLFWLGQFHEARGWFETNLRLGRSLSLADRMAHLASDLSVFSGAQLGWLLWFIGETDAVQPVVDDAWRIAQQSATRQDLCIVLCFKGLIAWCRRDIALFATTAESAWAIAESEGLQFWRGLTSMLMVLARVHAGHPVDFEAVIAGTTALRIGYRAAATTEAWFAITVLAASGHPAEALAMANQALAVADLTEHRYCRMDIWRIKGECLALLGQPGAAADASRMARRLAADSGATGWLAQWEQLLQQLDPPSA